MGGCEGKRSKVVEDVEVPFGSPFASGPVVSPRELQQTLLRRDGEEGEARPAEQRLEVEPNEGSSGHSPKKRKRLYYIDWMRVIAIYLVVAYHTVQALDWVSLYDGVTGMKRFIITFRATALQVGMPMFFHISGRAQALCPTVGLQKTYARRVQRLLLPFAVCYVVLIPPWQYIDEEYDWQDPSSFTMKANPYTWLLHYYTSWKFVIKFDMAWLWFLPALFAITFLSAPLMLMAESYKMERMRLRIGYPLATLVLWGALCYGLRLCDFGVLFCSCAVLGPLSAVLIAQFAPLPQQGSHGTGTRCRRCWWALRAATLAQILASVGIVLGFGYAEIDPPQPGGSQSHDPRAAIPFLVLCLGFYTQGYFVQRWSQGCKGLEGKEAPWWVWLERLCGAFVLQLTLMTTSPSRDVESGHFIYPIYSRTYSEGPEFGAVHVLGTWCYIGIFVSLFQAYGENVIAKSLYKHATSSTIVVYIFHWVFVKVAAFWMLNPTLVRWKRQIMDHWWLELLFHVDNVWVALFWTLAVFIFAVLCSLSVYAALRKCSCLGRLFGL